MLNDTASSTKKKLPPALTQEPIPTRPLGGIKFWHQHIHNPWIICRLNDLQNV